MSNTLVIKRLENIEATQKKIMEMLSPASSQVEKKYLSTEEAADYLNLSIQTLYRYTMNKKIHFYRFSRKLFFLKEDLDQFITGQQKQGL